MSRKPRFNPEITRVKLNPEQAVLLCDCFDLGRVKRGTGTDVQVCVAGIKGQYELARFGDPSGSSS